MQGELFNFLALWTFWTIVGTVYLWRDLVPHTADRFTLTLQVVLICIFHIENLVNDVKFACFLILVLSFGVSRIGAPTAQHIQAFQSAFLRLGHVDSTGHPETLCARHNIRLYRAVTAVSE